MEQPAEMTDVFFLTRKGLYSSFFESEVFFFRIMKKESPKNENPKAMETREGSI